MPALTLEDGMPHVNNVVPRLRYSSIKDWDSVYNWYKELAKGRYTADADIEAKVEQLTNHLTTIDAENTGDLSFCRYKHPVRRYRTRTECLPTLVCYRKFFGCNTAIVKIKQRF